MVGVKSTRQVTITYSLRQMTDNRSTLPVYMRDNPTNHLYPSRSSLPQLLSPLLGAELCAGTLLGGIGAQANYETRTEANMLPWRNGRTPSLVKSRRSPGQGKIASGRSFCQTFMCPWCVRSLIFSSLDPEVTSSIAF